MKMTHSEAIAGCRAFYATTNLRIARRLAKESYDKACRARDRAYAKVKQDELAKLESNDDA